MPARIGTYVRIVSRCAILLIPRKHPRVRDASYARTRLGVHNVEVETYGSRAAQARVNTHAYRVWAYLLSCYRAVPANDVIVSNENSSRTIVFLAAPPPPPPPPLRVGPSRSLNLGNRFNPSSEGTRLNWELIARRGRASSSIVQFFLSLLFFSPFFLISFSRSFDRIEPCS